MTNLLISARQFIEIGSTIYVDEPTPKLDGEGEWYLGWMAIKVRVAEISIELDEERYGNIPIENQVKPRKINFSALKKLTPDLTVWIKSENGDYYSTREILGVKNG